MTIFIIIDNSITIKIIPNHITWLCTIKYSLTSSTCIIYLLLILPDARIRHTIEVANRFTYLNTAYIRRVLENSIHITNNIIKVLQTSYLICIRSNIQVCTIIEILSYFVVPRKRNFNTLILYITTIDIRSTIVTHTHGPFYRSLNQPILSLLIIPVETQAQSLIQETRIKAKV